MKKIEKQVIIITGASSGIGLATAQYLLQLGHIVVGVARSKTDEVAFDFFCADVTNYDAMQNVFNMVEQKYGHIDCLINNAGMGIAGAMEYTSNEAVDKLFNVNVNAVVNLSKMIIPYLRKSKHGRIVNIGSFAGVAPIPFQACYSASKAAVENYSMALANEVSNFNISVTCVRPGDTKTGFTSARVKEQVKEDNLYKDRILKSIQKMEKDEVHGVSPLKVAKVINRVISSKHPPLTTTVGGGYKFLAGLAKILPNNLKNKIIKRIYG